MGLETAAIIAAVAAAAPALYSIGKDVLGPGTSNIDSAGAQKMADMQKAAGAYGAYRPDIADARMKAMAQQLSAYKGAGNMMAAMYGAPEGEGGGGYTPGGGGFHPATLPPPADRVPPGPLVPKPGTFPQPPPGDTLPPPGDRIPPGPIIPRPDTIPQPPPGDTLPPPADRIPPGPIGPNIPPPIEPPGDTLPPPADRIPEGPIGTNIPPPPDPAGDPLPPPATIPGGLGRLGGGPIGRAPIGAPGPAPTTPTPTGDIPTLPPFADIPQGLMGPTAPAATIAPEEHFLQQLAKSLAKPKGGTGSMASLLSKKA